MKQFLLFTLSCVMVTASLQTQQLKGVNVNKQGEPVPNSTIYIYEIAKGIAADNLGEFQTALAPGSYTCEFRSLG
ncbi:carboxypeptidase-like regulatory domain-containing protein [Proteiniphilum sp. UBA5384]|uniref:carboxypeptidase-like regulatory domain-containing protein n=1 Tax=Proteiniphilum sp. UBA5384 TaxID=1947279 RepID=UPI0025D4FBC9|nr:carboxypeptidase-like regulatory domain-containing protein [Proteiniphilum sp. UBA5384]